MEIQIGLLGLGVVGTGVFELMQEHAATIASRCGSVVPAITRVVVRDADRARRIVPASVQVSTAAADLLDDPAIAVVLELMGGTEPARNYVETAIKNGKHVVLANKELMARCGPALLEAAHERSLALLFEASVAGGIPILRAIRESLSGDRVVSLQGIVNGTTNYILTRMTSAGLSFAAALQEAQALGYAEADPSNDVQGVDAMYKLAILVSIAFGTPVDVAHLAHRGIAETHAADIVYARDLGFVIKLLAEARSDDRIYAGVEPCLVPTAHPLASVLNNFNAVLVRGEWAGDLMFYGQGAGALPTATAVVSDLIQVCQGIGQGNRYSWPGAYWQQTSRPVVPLSELRDRYYLRLQVHDEPGVLAAVATVFGQEGVSFQSVLQKSHGEDPVDVVFMTHQANGGAIRRALEKVRSLAAVQDVAAVYRVL